MTRLARIVAPGIPHHVTQRGNRRQPTFFCPQDYKSYLSIMSEKCQHFGVEVWGYCLMPNHTHLIAVPKTAESLTNAIGYAHQTYTSFINYKMGWKGHLWQGRYFSSPMDDERLATCMYYVEMNPVRAGISSDPFAYEWSSAQAHLEGKDDRLVTVKPMLDQWPDWRAFLERDVSVADIEMIRKNTRTGRAMGSDVFVANLEDQLGRTIGYKKRGPKFRDSEENPEGHVEE